MTIVITKGHAVCRIVPFLVRGKNRFKVTFFNRGMIVREYESYAILQEGVSAIVHTAIDELVRESRILRHSTNSGWRVTSTLSSSSNLQWAYGHNWERRNG